MHGTELDQNRFFDFPRKINNSPLRYFVNVRGLPGTVENSDVKRTVILESANWSFSIVTGL